MTWWAKLLAFTAGFVVATGIETARADEAFLCDRGRIVYVAPGQLEQMKRTDPCIAGYFGAKVETTSPAIATPVATPKSATPQGPAGTPTAKPVLRALKDTDLSARRDAEPFHVAARRGPPVAAEGTDFRNVPVLNALSSEGARYRHDH
jgi:hypothetical protein